MTGTPLYCPNPCGRRIGTAPGKAIWTGKVSVIPMTPDGLLYVPCERCRRADRPQWNRYEIAPPDAEEIEVQPDTHILDGEAA